MSPLRSWQRELEGQVTPEQQAERHAMSIYIRNYVKDALDGRVSAIEMASLASFDTAYGAILSAHEARIGRELSAEDRSTFWMIAASEWRARRAALAADLKATQESLRSPFRVFAS